MFWLAIPSNWQPAKWCTYALLLLVPGTLIVLPLMWLVGPHLDKGTRSRWQPKVAAEQYLDDATDLPDLERRMRVLERVSGGPPFVTFNH
ncbi:MAG TPA: DUF3563 family protein [Burkholderiales bacterium]|nr:DUF3563 family protein [Burkholderiales bacterium]